MWNLATIFSSILEYIQPKKNSVTNAGFTARDNRGYPCILKYLLRSTKTKIGHFNVSLSSKNRVTRSCANSGLLACKSLRDAKPLAINKTKALKRKKARLVKKAKHKQHTTQTRSTTMSLRSSNNANNNVYPQKQKCRKAGLLTNSAKTPLGRRVSSMGPPRPSSAAVKIYDGQLADNNSSRSRVTSLDNTKGKRAPGLRKNAASISTDFRRSRRRAGVKAPPTPRCRAGGSSRRSSRRRSRRRSSSSSEPFTQPICRENRYKRQQKESKLKRQQLEATINYNSTKVTSNFISLYTCYI